MGWFPALVQKIPSYALTWMFFQQLKQVPTVTYLLIHTQYVLDMSFHPTSRPVDHLLLFILLLLLLLCEGLPGVHGPPG